jgi:hypothetical protein
VRAGTRKKNAKGAEEKPAEGAKKTEFVTRDCKSRGAIRLVEVLRLVRLITPASKDRSLGTPMTPDFAQDDPVKQATTKANTGILALPE